MRDMQVKKQQARMSVEIQESLSRMNILNYHEELEILRGKLNKISKRITSWYLRGFNAYTPYLEVIDRLKSYIY